MGLVLDKRFFVVQINHNTPYATTDRVLEVFASEVFSSSDVLLAVMLCSVLKSVEI
jgi:hypothetical protein